MRVGTEDLKKIYSDEHGNGNLLCTSQHKTHEKGTS